MIAHAFAHTVRNGARWLFLVTLVFAPWAYGGTTEAAVAAIDVLLATVLLLWLLGLALERRRPSVPLALLIPGLLLCVLGWCSAFNATAIYDDEFEMFVSLRSGGTAWIPHSVDQVVSIAWMIRGTLLLGTVCFVADLSLRSDWLLRIWHTVALAGFSIAVLGLLQKASGAGAAFWAEPAWKVETFFATFYYHANAGAYLNLVFPPIAALARRALQKAASPWPTMLWTGAALVTAVAIFSNTSRMSQALGGVMVVVLAFWVIAGVRRLLARTNVITAVVVAAILGWSIYAVAQMSQLDQGARRWQNLTANIQNDARWTVAKLAIGTVRDAGIYGFGPGTFRVVFPRYTQVEAPDIHGGWIYLHQDYLQTLVEWGWLGGTLWALIFFGGAGVALMALLRSRRRGWYPRQRQFVAVLLLALGTLTIHGLVDFPFQIYSIQLYASTYLGVCWASSRWPSPRYSGEDSRFRTDTADARSAGKLPAYRRGDF